MSSASIELKTDEGVVRFNFANSVAKEGRLQEKVNKVAKKVKKKSKKAKINELRFFRLKAKKKIKSPNPEVQIRYKLEKVSVCLFKPHLIIRLLSLQLLILLTLTFHYPVDLY